MCTDERSGRGRWPYDGGGTVTGGLYARIVNAVPPLDVEVDIPAGKVVAVMGPNGAGKSTLLNVVAGLLRTDGSSTLTIDGRRLIGEHVDVPAHQRGVALLAQDPGLFPHMTVRQNVGFAPAARRESRSRTREQVQTWLDATGTGELADRRPHQLSGGQAQRVAIARALAAQPEVLLLDEPLRALDVDAAARIRALLRGLLRERQQTTLFVTHDIVDAVTLADQLIILDQGRMVESGGVREVLASPRSRFAATLAGLSLIEGRWDGKNLQSALGALTGVSEGDLDAGCNAVAVFAADSASVFLTDPAGGSPRNILRARVLQVEPRGDHARIRCDAAGVDVSAEITWDSVRELPVDVGAEVYLTIKAGDMRIYPV